MPFDPTFIQGQAQAAAPPTPQPQATASAADAKTNLYPNLRVQQALEQMLAMGFSNTGNWLGDMLEQHKGDIVAVLDEIKAKATQQLDSLRHAGI